LNVSSARAGLEAFSTPTLVHFGVTLLLAAILSAPWQALWQAGLLVAASGLGGVALIVIAIRWEHRQSEYRLKVSDWLWYRILPLVLYAALLVASIVLPRHPAPALYVIAAAMGLLLLVGIRNAWDSVTFLAIERSQLDKNRQD
jgi:hypothetical protein